MKKFDIVLIVLVALQGFLWFSDSSSTDSTQEEFYKPSLAIKQLNRVEIIMGKKQIVMNRDKKMGWQLKLDEGQAYPLQKLSMDRFLSRIFAYREGPIKGTSEAKAKEHNVADDQFYSQITLKNDVGDSKVFYVAPGPHETDYLRMKGDNKIYQLQPTIRWWLSADRAKWVNPFLSNINWPVQKFLWNKPGRNPLRISSDGLQWRNSVGSPLNDTKVKMFVKEFSQLTIDRPMGTLLEPASNEKPFDLTLELTLQTTSSIGKSITFQINGEKKVLADGVDGYIVKVKGDPRLAFIKKERFIGLIEEGPYVFTTE